MAMTITHDSACMSALTQVNINIAKQNKAMKQLALGERLTSAGDGAAEYSISEKMKVKMRALGQDKQNVQNGASMLQIAERAIQRQIDILRTVKAKVIDANNDTNTDEDRVTIQKEIDQCWDQMEDIAYTTNFNGRYLLNGGTVSKTIASWVVLDEPVCNEDSILPDLIPAKFQTLDSQTGPFDIFSQYKTSVGSSDALGIPTTGSQIFSGGTTTAGSSAVLEFDLKGLADADGTSISRLKSQATGISFNSCDYGTHYKTQNFILTTTPSTIYNDSSYPAATKIDISSCNKIQDVANLLKGNLSSSYWSDISVAGSKMTLTPRYKGVSSGNSSIIGFDAAAVAEQTYGPTPGKPAISITGAGLSGTLTGGVNVSGWPGEPDYRPGTYATFEKTGFTPVAGTAFTVGSKRVVFYDGTIDPARIPSGDVRIKTDTNGSWTVGNTTMTISDGKISFKANGTGSSYNGIQIKDAPFTIPATSGRPGGTTPAKAAVTAATGISKTVKTEGTNPVDTTATGTIDLSAYKDRDDATIKDDVEAFIKDLKRKTLSLSSWKSIEFIDRKYPESIDAQKIYPSGTVVYDLNILRKAVLDNGKSISEAFADVLTSNLPSGASPIVEVDGDGKTTGVTLKAYNRGTYGNSESLTIKTGQLSSYEIDFGKYLNNAGVTGSVPNYLNEKGFRFYCNTCKSQWFNIVFNYPGANAEEEEGMGPRPASGKPPAFDIKTLTVDVTDVTDAKSLVKEIYEQVMPHLTGTDPNYNHSYRMAIDEEAGKLVIYDDRRRTINKTTDAEYQEQGSKIASGVLDNVIKERRSVLVDRLVIQHTDKANRNIMVNLPNTTFEQVFGFKKGNMEISDFNVYTREMRDALLGKAKTDTTPEEKGWLDTGLDYLTGAVTLAGAQITRMHEAEANIVTEHENTTAAESIIRDTDMAMAMTEFTKYNVLAQAAQSMLAQANQNSSNVLSLLQ